MHEKGQQYNLNPCIETTNALAKCALQVRRCGHKSDSKLSQAIQPKTHSQEAWVKAMAHWPLPKCAASAGAEAAIASSKNDHIADNMACTRAESGAEWMQMLR